MEEKVVEGPQSEDLGVPVVDGHAVGLRELGRRETFHPRSALCFSLLSEEQMGITTYAKATHFSQLGP